MGARGAHSGGDSTTALSLRSSEKGLRPAAGGRWCSGAARGKPAGRRRGVLTLPRGRRGRRVAASGSEARSARGCVNERRVGVARLQVQLKRDLGILDQHQGKEGNSGPTFRVNLQRYIPKNHIIFLPSFAFFDNRRLQFALAFAREQTLRAGRPKSHKSQFSEHR